GGISAQGCYSRGGWEMGGLADLDREVRDRDLWARRQDHGAFERVLELTHIAWPGILLQHLQCCWRDREPRAVDLTAIVGQKMLHQRRNVLAPVPQWRQGEGDHIEPVVQVLAEGPLLHRLL